METAQLGGTGATRPVFPSGMLAAAGSIMPRRKQMVVVRRAANGFFVMEEGSPTDTWLVSKELDEMAGQVREMFVEPLVEAPTPGSVLPQEGEDRDCDCDD